MKYRLRNNVSIVCRRHNVVVTADNFTDQLAEMILTDPIYSVNYGHNIEVLDPAALKALQARKVIHTAPLVYEIDVKKKSPESTLISKEASKGAVKSKGKRGRPKLK